MLNESEIKEKQAVKQVEKHGFNIIINFFFLLVISSIVLGIAVQRIPVVENFDKYYYNLLANGTHSTFLNVLVYPINVNFFPFGSSSALSFFVTYLLFYSVYLFFKDRSKLPLFFLHIFLVTLLTAFLYISNTTFAFRPRPFTVLPNHLSTAYKNSLINYNSFPSGHSRQVAAYSTIIAYFSPELRIVVILLSLFVAFSRVYVGAHYPTDVIAGLIVGYFAGQISIKIIKELIYLKENIRNPL